MTVRHLPALPDPSRFGGPAWVKASGGVMSPGECGRGLGHATYAQVLNLWERLTPFVPRAGNLDDLPSVPDSRLVKLAEEAALEQSPELLAHGFRSAIFGRALSHVDNVPIDPELMHVCGLLHDVGIMRAVVGEDFTLRSAAVARSCAHTAGETPEVGEHLADALIVHTTVGVRPDRDGALGSYTQYGAMVDLTGMRLSHLPKPFVRHVLDTYPRGSFKREILRRLDLEANSLRGGRFAFAKAVGFGLAVKYAPYPS